MIDLKNQTMGIQSEGLPIREWVVWFQTPFGVFCNLPDAIKRVEENDLDPNLSILPIPVALSGEEYEPIYPRG